MKSKSWRRRRRKRRRRKVRIKISREISEPDDAIIVKIYEKK